MFYYITSENKIVASNLPKDYFVDFNLIRNKITQGTCPITGKKMRHGNMIFDQACIYIATSDETITNRILKRYFTACNFFIPKFVEGEKIIKEKETQNFRRLKHNLITHNTNILQELEKAFPVELLPKGKYNQVNYIKEILQKKSEEVAVSILRVIKSANFMKSDFDVYDMLNSTNPYLEFDNHNIHKVILLIINPFWLDLIEKEIIIDIAECMDLVRIDYKSISVVFSHLFDNLTKYILPDSILKISFNTLPNSILVNLEMTSLKITDEDMKYLYEENYSGEYAKKLGKSGDGIGMSVVKKLLELNQGKIDVLRGIDPSQSVNKMGILFERNKFVITLNKSKQ